MQPLSVSAQTRLLVVAPHPDDETLGCGVLIQRVLAAGGAVQILLMTDGDNNPWPQRYMECRVHIDDVGRRRWGARRRVEVEQAIARLGVSASALRALGWRDMGITRRLREDTSTSIAAIRIVVDEFQPTLMCLPALHDTHPDHGATHVLCRLALATTPVAPMLLAYPVHGGAGVSTYPVVLQASTDEQQRKSQALDQHHTQMVLSGERMRRLGLSPERYMPVNTDPGEGPLPWHPPVVLRHALRLLIATPTGVQDICWQDAPLDIGPGGSYRLRWSAQMPGFVKLHLDWPSPWIFDHWGWSAL